MRNKALVKVEIIRSTTNGKITSYKSEGHAYYDEPGKDIVCAGVSAIIFGTYNSIEALLGIVSKHTIHAGFFRVDIPERIDPKTFEQAQLLLESMVVMLNSIQESYGEFLTIKQTIR
ncbi:ribosomal-processing cysteine protease Prp [Rossellomorea marisflavi]|uniref:ribosomal-processing cysteine protease Prp n=1 Tax=Rossellomorea marisflavi TaxID=189381 RepID=UPI00207A902A|nr:ribosomal-processing cysteine protease Prp [Rossellomorea marisflavi]USK91508.1 ribosomal-processing cysteine protease Prp [Rossellomorea marisflavi]